jgi:hypothetical protein
MSSEHLHKWRLTPFEAATNHFMKVYDQIQTTSHKKMQEVEVVLNFFKDFGEIERKYKDELVGLCIKYQKEVYEAFADEKMEQFFQMVFNNLLQRSDKITRGQKTFTEIKEKMSVMKKELQKTMKTRMEELDIGLVRYAELVRENKGRYEEYIKECNILNNKSHKKLEILQDEMDGVYEMEEMVLEAEDHEDQIKLVDRIANFKMDLGKRKAQKMKDKFREQRSKKKWSEKNLKMFKEKWEELKNKVVEQTRLRMKKIKKQEKAVIGNTENKINETSWKEEGVHKELSKDMFEYLKKIETNIQDCVKMEMAWKQQTKSQMVEFMYKYFPENKEMILKKAQRTEKTIEDFTSKFNLIAKVRHNRRIR